MSPYPPVLDSIIVFGNNVIPVHKPLVLNLDEYRYELINEDSQEKTYDERLTWHLENDWSVVECHHRA